MTQQHGTREKSELELTVSSLMEHLQAYKDGTSSVNGIAGSYGKVITLYDLALPVLSADGNSVDMSKVKALKDINENYEGNEEFKKMAKYKMFLKSQGIDFEDSYALELITASTERILQARQFFKKHYLQHGVPPRSG